MQFTAFVDVRNFLIEWNQSLILNYIVRQNTAVLSSCINIEEMDICFFYLWGPKPFIRQRCEKY
jgi:hypothetical protein